MCWECILEILVRLAVIVLELYPPVAASRVKNFVAVDGLLLSGIACLG
jgi:hypothetical protein